MISNKFTLSRFGRSLSSQSCFPEAKSNKFALSRFGRSLSLQSCYPEAKSADAKSPEDNDTTISIECSDKELFNEDNISPHEVDHEISPASHSGKLSIPAVPPEISDLYPSNSDSHNSNLGVHVLQIYSSLATVRQVGGSGTHVNLNQSTGQIDPGYSLMSGEADSFKFSLATVPHSGGISGEVKGSGRRTYVTLYLAALKGDWEMAEDFLEFNPLALHARITRNSETALHIAAGARHTRFVEKLVNLMKPEDLALQNKVGNTALCFAAASGIRQIAERHGLVSLLCDGRRNHK